MEDGHRLGIVAIDLEGMARRRDLGVAGEHVMAHVPGSGAATPRWRTRRDKALATVPSAMFGGGGGMNPRKLNQMMEQMGIDIEELDAEEIVIRTGDQELVFDQPDVQRMDAQGQATYTITGEPETREAGGGEEATPLGAGDDAANDAESGDDGIPEADVGIVAQRTGASEDDAREALEETDGDLAAAVSRLE